MKVYKMNHEFYETKFKHILKLSNYQIIQNNNGKRPYYYSIEIKGQSILLPFRSNSSAIPNKYKFSTKSIRTF